MAQRERSDELAKQIADVRDMLVERVDILESEIIEIAKDQAVAREIVSALAAGRAADVVSTRWIIALIVTGALSAMFTSVGSCIQQREDIASIKATIHQMQREK